MSIIQTLPLSSVVLTNDELANDRKERKRFEGCGTGAKAVYLKSRFLDSHYYIPYDSIQRVYKRVAMSKGGYTGKGVFGSIPYIVVEYDGGKEAQAAFKYEEQVDLMLSYIGKIHPEIKRMSKAAESKWLEKQQKLEEKRRRISESKHRDLIRQLEDARAFLEKSPDLYTELSSAAKAKRSYDRSKPAYKWVALAIMTGGLAACAYGIYTLISRSGSFGLYFLMFGLAAIFFFSGSNVIPTAKNNRKAIEKRLNDSVSAMERYLTSQNEFILPPRYAHPGVLNRMIEVLADNRATSISDAFETVKSDLRAINSSVTVEQEEYDEIVAIKPLFLVHEYR